MKSEIEIAINLWYREWLVTHDPFKDSFEDEVYRYLPNIKITLNITDNHWYIL